MKFKELIIEGFAGIAREESWEGEIFAEETANITGGSSSG